MTSEPQHVYRVVDWLLSEKEEEKYQAALAMRSLASQASNKQLIREAGGIQRIITLLDSGPDKPLTVVAAETISCLVADDHVNRELLRHYGGVEKLVKLLNYGPQSECTHRALLALRILTDKEIDRMAILQARGIPPLIRLLNSGPDSEITEYAAAALGNLAAGSQQIKDAIREAHGIPPLVALLREGPDEISAELAAVVLRNLSLQNETNRTEIQRLGGLQPLLRLLSTGQDKLHYPLPCTTDYIEIKATTTKKKIQTGQCCFDPVHGHLCLSVLEPSKFNCFGTAQITNPRDKSAERYSLLRKLSITEPDNQTLELNFTASDPNGVLQIAIPGKQIKVKGKRLQRVVISPCAATEIKGSIMRMLTRMHLEREFRTVTNNIDMNTTPLNNNNNVRSVSNSESPASSSRECEDSNCS